MRHTLVVILGIVALFVIGCGKKQPVATTPSIHRPVANAGGNQIVAVNQTVVLDASRSFDPDGDDLTYQWKQVSGPPVTMTNSTSAQVALTLKVKGRYVFEVSVSDGTETAAVRVAVTVGKPPVASAGDDQTIQLNQTVTLDASGSSDSDGDSLAYQWQQVSGPPMTMTDGTLVRTMVTLTAKGNYIFAVIVSDGVETAIDSARVTVPNSPPVVFAGDDQTVRLNQTVTLDVSRSSDPDGDKLTYEWQQVSGPAVTLADAHSVQASFTPMTLAEYSFEVSVTDGTVIVTDQVFVRVVDPFQVSATMEMVWVDSGTFLMGSPVSETDLQYFDPLYRSEAPQHEVTITKGFYLGKYEVTQGQWLGVMDTRPWAEQSFVQDNPDNPAVYVSWEDAQAFIGKLNATEGSTAWRLPTEAEWEYACRAGTTTRWSYGDDESQLGRYAWYSANTWSVGERYAHSVGLKLPNPWGLYDMHGNVAEWCQDWFGMNYYNQSPKSDPAGPPTTDSTGPSIRFGRVYRGGGWPSEAEYMRGARRSVSNPSHSSYGLGFRCVRSVTP